MKIILKALAAVALSGCVTGAPSVAGPSGATARQNTSSVAAPEHRVPRAQSTPDDPARYSMPTSEDSERDAGPPSLFKKGFCYPTFPLGYDVVQKIDAKHYFAVRNERPENCLLAKCRAVLELEHFNPNLVGHLNALVEYLRTDTIHLSNGFDTEADFLRECTAYHKCGMRVCVGN